MNILCIPDKGYSRNTSYTLNQIFTFLLYYIVEHISVMYEQFMVKTKIKEMDFNF